MNALSAALCLVRTRSIGLCFALDDHARHLGLQVLDIIDTAVWVACRGDDVAAAIAQDVHVHFALHPFSL